MRIAMTLLALALAVGAGCKKKENAASEGSGSAAMAGSAAAGSGSAMAGSAAGSGSGSAAMAGSGSAEGSGSAMAAGSGAGSGSGSAMDAQAMAHHAGNCPSTVFGSTTTAELKGKDVLVKVTSKDKDAIAAIQKRTDEMLKARLGKKQPGEAHDQRGTHGQSIGLCPMHIPEGATAKAKNEKDGVVVTITPKDKPDELKKEIDGRITKAADWVKNNIKPGDDKNQGGVGGGKNDEGMNHSGQGDGKGVERKKGGGGDGSGGGKGTGGGGGKGTGGGSGAKK